MDCVRCSRPAPVALLFALAVIPHVAVIVTSLTATGQWYKSFLPAQFTFAHFGQRWWMIWPSPASCDRSNTHRWQHCWR